MNANSDPEGTSETGLHSANCAADREDLTGTVLGLVVDAPVVVQRQVQTVQNSVEIPQLQFGEQVADVPVMLARSCGSSTRSSLSDGGFSRILLLFSRSSVCPGVERQASPR